MKQVSLLPISAIIVTANRAIILNRTLQSLYSQSYQPAEVIIIDASETITEIKAPVSPLLTLIFQQAIVKGSATQRNQAFDFASQPYVLFMDDDIILEDDCIERLWIALEMNKKAGGVNALITNQQYHHPGTITKAFYHVMNGKRRKDYSGKCIGPVVNLLPYEDKNLPEVNEVDWLNTTCTLYRREALPSPLFDTHFTGYSLMEDVALSLRVKKEWLLLNARKAKIFHDSQPGNDKNNVGTMAEMDLVNRVYIMRKILNRTKFIDYCKLLVQQMYGGITSKQILMRPYWNGKINAVKKFRRI